MFSEQYRNDMNERRLSDEASERVLTALRSEADTTPLKHRTPRWYRAVALTACAAVVLAVLFAQSVERPRISFYPEIENPSTVTDSFQDEHLTYTQAFALLDDLQMVNGDVITESDGDAELRGTFPSTAPAATNRTEYSGYKGATGSDTVTNTQYANVDEADVVKAQGGYIYVLNRAERRLTIYRADGENTAVVAEHEPTDGENDRLVNMYLTNDRLVILYTHHETAYVSGTAAKERGVGGYSYRDGQVYAVIYDITDPTAPHYITAYGQDGTLTDSRMVNGVLYLITAHTVWAADEENIASFVPRVYRDGEHTAIAEKALCAVPAPQTPDYAVIIALSVAGNTARLAEKAVLGAGGCRVWANSEHLVLMQHGERSVIQEIPLEDDTARREYTYNETTDLFLFDIENGTVTQTAAATIDGTPDGPFALDEWNDHFRIAVTCTVYHHSEHATVTRGTEHVTYVGTNSQSEQYNRLYVLNSTLHEVGRIDNMAPDETVRSVRFEGNIGYVVTFRQTDPLFAVDLSDPQNPTVLSALKITGFSEYLHPFGDGRLFGFGYAGTENGLNGKLKLTMFDTTNKTDVTVKTYLELPAEFHYSDALNDHHAILVDTARALVGVPLYTNNGLDYMLYHYDEENGFTPLVRCTVDNAQNPRGLFIDDYFYVVHQEGITVYDSSFAPVATV
ncbi:MAG: hypothetical protein E7552_01815 [Ruminococcaceae bacterium]|nr:hypothetical protein [Oscillospiraceae bacterium]